MAQTQDVVNAALQDIGVLADGETPSTSASNVCLVALNNLLASWDIERLSVYSINENTYTLTADTQEYPLGPTATSPGFAGTRPTSIRAASIIITNGSSKYVFPLKLIPAEIFNQERERTTKADIPTMLYNDNAYPNTNLWLFPIPQLAGSQIELWTWEQITAFASLTTTFDLPPGYQRALELNLAIEIAPKFQRPVDQTLGAIAMQAKEAIRALNAPPIPGAGGEAQAQAAVETAARPQQPQGPAQ